MSIREARVATGTAEVKELARWSGRWWTKSDADSAGGRKLCFKYPYAARFYRCAEFEVKRSEAGDRELILNGLTFRFQWRFTERADVD